MEVKYTKKIPESGRASRSQLQIVGGGKRNVLDIEKDAWWAVGEIARGKTYQEVADALNEKNGYKLTKSAVWRDVERVLVEWKRENMENIDAFIAKELARLEEIERNVLVNFERSKVLRPGEYAVLMKRGLTIDEIDDMYKERELPGDPRYLETMLHLQKQRMDLLGLSKGNDVPQNTIVQYNFGDIRMEELTAMADALQERKFVDDQQDLIND